MPGETHLSQLEVRALGRNKGVVPAVVDKGVRDGRLDSVSRGVASPVQLVSSELFASGWRCSYSRHGGCRRETGDLAQNCVVSDFVVTKDGRRLFLILVRQVSASVGTKDAPVVEPAVLESVRCN